MTFYFLRNDDHITLTLTLILFTDKMGAGQGGLILALLTFGFLLRFIPCKINCYDKSNIRVDDLGYYSSRNLNLLPKCNYVLKTLCLDPADHKHKNKAAISKNSLHNGFIIICELKRALYGIKCVLRIF
jgi:hypothetical protein